VVGEVEVGAVLARWRLAGNITIGHARPPAREATTAAVDTGLLPAISCSVAYRAPAGAPWHSFRTSKWRKGGGSRASDSD
jgi:hypothetical protein